MPKLETSQDIADHLLSRSVRDGGCLRWTGAHTPKGYGQVVLDDKREAVHRVAHRLWVGPIPDGYEVDHVHDRGCRNRDCIEPTHLEAVTHAENVRRQVAQLTHCRNGHALAGANVIRFTSPKGYAMRRCRTCKNAQQAASKARRRAA